MRKVAEYIADRQMAVNSAIIGRYRYMADKWVLHYYCNQFNLLIYALHLFLYFFCSGCAESVKVILL